MRPCSSCFNAKRCRVPRDMVMMERVLARIGREDRYALLLGRLRHYTQGDSCLVQAGIVAL